jgi:hypothetical protein
VDPQEITEELEHPGARNLLDSATLLRLAIVDIVDGVPDEFVAASTKALGADEVAEFEIPPEARRHRIRTAAGPE